MLDLLSALAQNQVALPMPTRVLTSFRVHRHIYRMLVLLSVLAQDQVALPIPPLPIPPLEVALPIPPLPTPPLRRGMVHSAVPTFSQRQWAMRAYRILAAGGPVDGRRGDWHEQIQKISTRATETRWNAFARAVRERPVRVLSRTHPRMCSHGAS